MEKLMENKFIGKRCVLIVLAFVFVVIGCSCDTNRDRLVTDTIANYFDALKAHNVDGIKACVDDGLQGNYSDDEAVSQFVYTVEDCSLVNIDLDSIQSSGSEYVRVLVTYQITYSDDYIPVGSRNVGENTIREFFELKLENDKYVITGITKEGI